MKEEGTTLSRRCLFWRASVKSTDKVSAAEPLNTEPPQVHHSKGKREEYIAGKIHSLSSLHPYSCHDIGFVTISKELSFQ